MSMLPQLQDSQYYINFLTPGAEVAFLNSFLFPCRRVLVSRRVSPGTNGTD